MPSKSSTDTEQLAWATTSQSIFPALKDPRETIFRACQLLNGHSHEEIAKFLKVPTTKPELVDTMLNLSVQPVAPAIEVYDGVLYSALDAKNLASDIIAQAADPNKKIFVLISSALFDLVTLTDRIPAYRLSAGSQLPTLGKVSTWWKKQNASLLKEISQFSPIIDCRSTAYQQMLPLPAISINAIRMKNGIPKSITHDAKYFRGLVTRQLLLSQPDTLQDALEALSDDLKVDPKTGSKLSYTLNSDSLVVTTE